MTNSPQQSDQPAGAVILCCSAAWLLFFSAWLLVLFSNGRWLPGLHGPGTLGNFLSVVAVCFIGAAITAITASGTALMKFASLSPRLRIIGFSPIACMVILILVRFVTNPPGQ
jgi:hypothetical protein